MPTDPPAAALPPVPAFAIALNDALAGPRPLLDQFSLFSNLLTAIIFKLHANAASTDADLADLAAQVKPHFPPAG